MTDRAGTDSPDSGSPAVTVAVPTYRDLDYVPGALESVSAQDYPNLDVLVSDNGPIGQELDEIVERHCHRPYRIRRTGESVSLPEHFDALTRSARGEYFLLLCDDDELAPDCVSRLVEAMEGEPEVGVALPRVEVLDREGERVHREVEAEPPPPRMGCLDFLRRWCVGDYPFTCFVTNLARTREIRDVGGYPDFAKGNGIDNGLVVKLILGREVAYVSGAEFRYRVYEESTGLAVDYRELATAQREFIEFLEEDPHLQRFSERSPEQWEEARSLLTEMAWRTYRHRWKTMYRERLSRWEWLRAAFAMPFIPAYYRDVLGYLGRKIVRTGKRTVTGAG